jgi:hypothetical protein
VVTGLASEKLSHARDRRGLLRCHVSRAADEARILCEKLLIISQRFFGIPPFRFYALADGIRRILSQSTFSPPEMPPPSLQMELTLGWEC